MSQTDKVVVLGGAGFIGRYLVAQLRGKTQSLTVVSRRAASAAARDGVRYVNGDVTDDARMTEVLEDATVVYQLTLEGDWARGADSVAKACLRHGVRRLIYAST